MRQKRNRNDVSHIARNLGIEKSDFEWLILNGATQADETERPFTNLNGHDRAPVMCVLIVYQGEHLPVSLFSREALDSETIRQALRWNANTRSLCLGNRIIKRFSAHAPNQEAVLAAFEEEAWVERIDDPLPRGDGDAKRRLHDTIKCLNQGHRIKRIKFRGDGTGEGVIWVPI